MANEGDDMPNTTGGYVAKNILVTGGVGFIGSHVCARLCHEYPSYKVVAFDKLDYCASATTVQWLQRHANFKFVKGDICNSDLLNYTLEQENIDTILHFAAETHVDNSFGNSLSFTRNNVLGTHILLEAARQHGSSIKRIVHVSTDEVYGGASKGSDPHAEVAMLAPTNPYAATKACGEMLVKAYQQSYKLPIIVSRGNNVFGPRQFPEKLVPKLILLASRDQPLPIHGKGDQERSFIFAGDVADAFDVILHRGRTGEVYNIGTGNERTVLAVAACVCEALGKDPTELIHHVEDRLHQDIRYNIDDSKLQQLGWTPKVGWREGIRRTVEWYTSHPGYWEGMDRALQGHPTPPTRSGVPPTTGIDA